MEELINNILNLVRKKMREQGAYDRASYREYVEEAVDYYLAKGRLSEEENTQFLIDTLMERWESIDDKLTASEK